MEPKRNEFIPTLRVPKIKLWKQNRAVKPLGVNYSAVHLAKARQLHLLESCQQVIDAAKVSA